LLHTITHSHNNLPSLVTQTQTSTTYKKNNKRF